MANFEGLIRQALARQDATDPEIREKVYQASRNALARMIAAGGAQPPSVIQQQRAALEHSIDRIEAAYRGQPPPPPPRQLGPGSVTPHSPQAEPRDDRLPPHRPDEEKPTPAAEDELFLDEVDRPDFGGGGRRLFAIAAILVLLAVIGWLLYWLVVTIGVTTDTGQPAAGAPQSETGERNASDGEAFLTILSPVDTDNLQTAGRGTAELISQSNLEMIRLTSVRSEIQPDVPAEPIIINLPSGVIEQIAGRRVTVEVLARSGSTGPATFAIDCDLSGVDACGRKRFRVGLQPEAIVFTINVPSGLSGSDRPHFAINTDITGAAALTGKGDPLDILYARLRPAES